MEKLYKIAQVQNFMKIPPGGIVPCGQTDGQKEMRKLIVVFYNSAKAPKIGVVNIILAGVDAVKLLPENGCYNGTSRCFNLEYFVAPLSHRIIQRDTHIRVHTYCRSWNAMKRIMCSYAKDVQTQTCMFTRRTGKLEPISNRLQEEEWLNYVFTQRTLKFECLTHT